MAVADPTPLTAPTQGTSTLAPAPAAPPAMLPAAAPGRYLAVGEGAGAELLAITADVCHVGRAPTCDVVLEDASVSRRHAVITRRGDVTVILDDRSLNGVEVAGRRVAEAELRDGDVIRLGRVAVRYVEVAAGVGAAAA
jgi:pSer/pThr/pTyr-binding forkhead associated (FHA) protein